MKELTPRQAEILQYLKKYRAQNGYAPTLRETSAYFRLSGPRAAKKHLDALEAKGTIHRKPRSPRALEIREPARVRLDQHPPGVPILGRIRAGRFNLAAEEALGRLSIDSVLTRDPSAFALQVRGESMTGAGILDGDYAVISPRTPFADGAIVAALLGDEATLKRFRRDREQVRLEAAHPSFEPIVLTSEDESLRIIGRVVALVRKL